MYFIRYTDSKLCLCVDSSNCTYPSGIYSALLGSHSFMYQGIMLPPDPSSIQIPGLYVGCTPLDAVMQSPLECFYQEECLSLIFDTTINILPLNNSISGNFSISSKVQTLIENLFIED